MTELDDTDRDLLDLLRVNSRASLMSLARKLNVDKANVQQRMDRLESEGVILGYTLLEVRPPPEPAPEALPVAPPVAAPAGATLPTAPAGARALLCMAAALGRLDEVVKALYTQPGLAALHRTNGRWDLVAELRAGSQPDLLAALAAARSLPGVSGTETCVLMDDSAAR